MLQVHAIQQKVLTRTVRRHSVGAFDEWLTDATPDGNCKITLLALVTLSLF